MMAISGYLVTLGEGLKISTLIDRDQILFSGQAA
jgi:hypothetical protein